MPLWAIVVDDPSGIQRYVYAPVQADDEEAARCWAASQVVAADPYLREYPVDEVVDFTVETPYEVAARVVRPKA